MICTIDVYIMLLKEAGPSDFRVFWKFADNYSDRQFLVHKNEAQSIFKYLFSFDTN